MVNYEKFTIFLTREYGSSPTKYEVAQAIIQWADLFDMGQNYGDIEGVSEYMNDDILKIAKKDISKNFLDKLIYFIKKERGEI